jgi:hypothetical protein
MTLAYPRPVYDQQDEAKTRAQIDQMDKRNRKTGQDLEVSSTERFIMTSPNGTRWVMGVSNAGATTWTAL